MKDLKLGCVVMAAGNAVRFGSNKLLENIGGKPLIAYSFASLPAELFTRIVVVTQYEEVESIAKDFSFTTIRNNHPERGISESIRLGTEALSDCEAICFSVADQPLLRRETLLSLVELYRKNRQKILSLAHEGRRGNPCIFPSRFFPALAALTGDQGGRAVIRNHEEELLLLNTAAEELWDVDTPEALELLKGRLL